MKADLLEKSPDCDFGKNKMQVTDLTRKFEIDGVIGDGEVLKQWRRLENPFGSDIVDNQIAAKVTHGGKGIEKIDVNTVVRPCMGGADIPDNFIYLR